MSELNINTVITKCLDCTELLEDLCDGLTIRAIDLGETCPMDEVVPGSDADLALNFLEGTCAWPE